MVTKASKFTGVMPCLMSSFEYDSDSVLEACLPVDIVHLFDAISGEFSDTGDMTYYFDTNESQLMINIEGVGVPFVIVSLETEKWTRVEPSETFIVKSIVKIKDILSYLTVSVESSGLYNDSPYHLVNELNKTHEGCRFYVIDDHVVIECDLYIAHGVAALNIMDIIASYISVVTTLTKKKKRDQNE